MGDTGGCRAGVDAVGGGLICPRHSFPTAFFPLVPIFSLVCIFHFLQ